MEHIIIGLSDVAWKEIAGMVGVIAFLAFLAFAVWCVTR